MKKKFVGLTVGLLALMAPPLFAESLTANDLYLPGHTSLDSLTSPRLFPSAFFSLVVDPSYTVLDRAQYEQTVKNTRYQLEQLLMLQQNHSHDLNEQVAFIVKQLADIPHLGTGAMGEGDWQPTSPVYAGGAVHLKQDPVYRLDGLDSVTFTQVVMALLHAHTLDEFDTHMLSIAYGAAGENLSDGVVHFYNRNHFVDGDFNPVNEKHGWISDAMTQTSLKDEAKETTATITRQTWLSNQRIMRTFSEEDGKAMIERFNTVYNVLPYSHFQSEPVTITYLPKEKLADRQPDGSYQFNPSLLEKIPTPSVLETVRDIKNWTIGNVPLKEVIGSEMSVSFIGLLYRQTFKEDDVIYQKKTCALVDDKKTCEVTPVRCDEHRFSYQKEHHQCTEILFANVPTVYPDNYYWYAKEGHYVCSPDKPTDNAPYTSCNHVESVPLDDYIIRKNNGTYNFMDTPSTLGIHIERLL